MFKRVIHENWTHIVPIISFLVTSSVFFIAFLQAWKMSKGKRERLASIPLDTDESSIENHQ